MATGDNMLTAVSVAKECALINPESPIFMVEIDEEKKLVWNALEMFVDDDEKLDNINKFTASIRKFIFKIRTIRFNKFKVCEKLYGRPRFHRGRVERLRASRQSRYLSCR